MKKLLILVLLCYGLSGLGQTNTTPRAFKMLPAVSSLRIYGDTVSAPYFITSLTPTAASQTLYGYRFNTALNTGATTIITASGSGYTNGSYYSIPITGLTNWFVDVLVSGNVVTKVTVSQVGTGGATGTDYGVTNSQIGNGTGFTFRLTSLGYTGVTPVALSVQNNGYEYLSIKRIESATTPYNRFTLASEGNFVQMYFGTTGSGILQMFTGNAVWNSSSINLTASVTVTGNLNTGNTTLIPNGTANSGAPSGDSKILNFANSMYSGGSTITRYGSIIQVGSGAADFQNRLSIFTYGTSASTTAGAREAITMFSSHRVAICDSIQNTSALINLGGTVHIDTLNTGTGSDSVLTVNNGVVYKVLRSTVGGSAGTTTNALTYNNSGTGDASGGAFNGSTAKTISYNSIGANPLISNTSGGIIVGTGTAGSLTSSTDFTYDATTKLMYNSLGISPTQVLSRTILSGTTTGSTVLYTVPANRQLFVTSIIVAVNAASGTTTGASASVTASTSGTIYTSNAMTGLDVPPKTFTFPNSGISIYAYSSGETINFNIGTAANGTNQTLAVFLSGYLVK